MDKSRQQFEEFIKFHMDDEEINNKFETANNGLNYADQHVDLMWISWQASRESLEVELPEPFIANENCETWCYDEDLVNQALINNGVKIKNE
ncbi:hypothetical protein [Proteus mirabilis]|uniref:hypothetical protein n=1 Tax=Proteus mirabilis TaxID=584 RepID=UPI001BAFC8D2|nr:hypothetical protein [Proteus mirabilis]MBS3831925.1 hypothetical protein [Proteus mirabilis]MBU5403462.1 hypothetical protein [Proteus mirabilis]MCT0074382.1 hypothetical protein [Proteus mirabilis]MDF7281885.1 hypothetical protein [Proteus mirabilis]UZE70014.1 hypothetical protein ONR66_13945 [Proteus mirabilis]